MKTLLTTELEKDYFGLTTYENDLQHKEELSKMMNKKRSINSFFKSIYGMKIPSFALIYENLEDKFDGLEFKQKVMENEWFKAYFKLAEGQLESADQLKYFEAAELGYAFYGFLAETLLIDFINREGLKYGLYAVKSTEEEDRVYGIDFKVGIEGMPKTANIQLKPLSFAYSCNNNKIYEEQKRSMINFRQSENSFYLLYNRKKEGLLLPFRNNFLVPSVYVSVKNEERHYLNVDSYDTLSNFMIELKNKVVEINAETA